MVGKLRPVGSRVPLPVSTAPTDSAWGDHYEAAYFASGTDALAMAVQMACLKSPDMPEPEVIIPAYGCPDLVAAVRCAGAVPVVVDVEDEMPFLDRSALIESISTSTVAVVAVNFLGIPERLEALSVICREHGLCLIEDSAQCFPPLSCHSLVADSVVVSFGRGKPINLMGGGALLRRGRFSEKERSSLENCPQQSANYGVPWRLKRLLFNVVLHRFCFSLIEKIPILGIGSTTLVPHSTITRKQVPERLLLGGVKAFYQRPLVHRWYDLHLLSLQNRGWILLNGINRGEAFLDRNIPRLRYAVLAPTSGLRDECIRALTVAGIGATALYESAITGIPGVAPLVRAERVTSAEGFASRLMTLPSHEDVSERDVQVIAKIMGNLSRVCD